VGLPVYARLEAAWCRVRRTTVTVPKLPAEFKARTIALLTDIHHGPYVSLDYVRRVGLVLSGHTHGGQVVVPFYGAPVVPSAYGRKYAQGLVRTDVTQVFVSRGIGNIAPPIRFNCRPEIALLTLA
jgi:predicted MPP superfamily phosphohydrolase